MKQKHFCQGNQNRGLDSQHTEMKVRAAGLPTVVRETAEAPQCTGKSNHSRGYYIQLRHFSKVVNKQGCFQRDENLLQEGEKNRNEDFFSHKNAEQPG